MSTAAERTAPESPALLLEVNDLVVRYRIRGSRRARGARGVNAVDGVTLRANEGEALGLVGESGCGKSTLARALLGLVVPSHGEVRFQGERLTAKREASVRRRIQMVFQDPYSSLNPRMSVQKIMTELLRIHGLVPKNRIDDRVDELMSMVGLPRECKYRYPRHLSGGQRQRVAIARALVLEPDVLVADEPTSALDVSIQASIVNLLDQLRRDLGLTLIFISHDLAVVREICDRIAVMYLGRIVEYGEAEALFDSPAHPYTRQLVDAVPRLDATRQRRDLESVPAAEIPSAIELPSGCRFHPRCPIARLPEPCATEDPELQRAPQGHRSAACHFASYGPPSRTEVNREMNML